MRAYLSVFKHGSFSRNGWIVGIAFCIHSGRSMAGGMDLGSDRDGYGRLVIMEISELTLADFSLV